MSLLIFLQFLVAYSSVRWPRIARLVRSEPTLLARNGAFCDAAMKRERITQGEALSAAVRAAGGNDIGDVAFLILESDGTISAGLDDRPGSPDPG